MDWHLSWEAYRAHTILAVGGFSSVYSFRYILFCAFYTKVKLRTVLQKLLSRAVFVTPKAEARFSILNQIIWRIAYLMQLGFFH